MQLHMQKSLSSSAHARHTALPPLRSAPAQQQCCRGVADRTTARLLPGRSLGAHVVTAAASPGLGTVPADAPPGQPPLSIVFVSAEVGPWSKTGGLGDVTGGLPIALADRGHRVYTIAPRYDQYHDAWDTSVHVNIGDDSVGFFHTQDKGVDRVWVDHDSFLAKVTGKTGSKLYGQKSGADYADNLQRFNLFNRAALEALRALPFGPGEDCVIVCNDWHTALLPVLLKDVYQPRGEFLNTRCALTVHNIAFQGRFWAKLWPQLGLPDSALPKFAFTDGVPRVYDETEDPDTKSAAAPGSKFDKLNWLKAGILSADKLLTVSPTYAEEMSENPSKGVELDDVIRAVGGAEGIVNGMDTTEWCPTQDKFLDVKYDEESVAEGKAFAKATLQAELGLPVDPSAPLFGFIGRLEEQKGVDVLLEALPQILGSDSKSQVVILGTGKKSLEAKVAQMEAQFPASANGVVEFNGPLAHIITAGADFMLVPSRFEPCGLIQMHAMQYGTVPVVASTGGLVDTVKDGVTGFHCGTLDPNDLLAADVDALAAAVNRAAKTYGTPQYEEMRAKCIGQELSWEVPAGKWESVLRDVQAGRKPQVVPKAGPTPVKNIDQPADPKKSDILAGRAAPRGKKPSSIGQAIQQSSGGGAKLAAPQAGGPAAAQAASQPAGKTGGAQQTASSGKPSPSTGRASAAIRAASASAGGARKPEATQKPWAAAAPKAGYEAAAGAGDGAAKPVATAAGAKQPAAQRSAATAAAKPAVGSNGSAASLAAPAKPAANGAGAAAAEPSPAQSKAPGKSS